MKIEILTPYFDKGEDRRIEVGEIIKADEEKMARLKKIDVAYKEVAEEGNENASKALDKMKKEELLAYAEANGIEVTAEMTKPQILEAIAVAEKGSENA
jgi:hypothetical protein